MTSFPGMPGFKIVRMLGKGGVATVYEGLDLELNRKVAIKFLTPDYRQPLVEARFAKEARLAANLYHSNIVSIFDVGYIIEGDQSVNYIVMEYLEETLKSRLRKTPGFRLTPGTALGIAGSVLKGLCHAHKEKILHRDIKPENIMFRGDGTPVIMDFGIARVMDALTQLTRTGMTAGTPEYMSPEQISASKEIDGRTDIYSLGVVLYEMLSGKRPYKGDNAVQMALQHLEAPIPELPEYLAPYQLLIDRMMAKKKEDRLSSLGEFLQIVQRIKESASAPPPEPSNVAGSGRIAAPESPPPETNFENIDSNTVLFFDTAELEGRISTKQKEQETSSEPAENPEEIAKKEAKQKNKTIKEIVLLFLLLFILVYILFYQPDPVESPGAHRTLTVPQSGIDNRDDYIPGLRGVPSKRETIDEPVAQDGKPQETATKKNSEDRGGIRNPVKKNESRKRTASPHIAAKKATAPVYRFRSRSRFVEAVDMEAFIINNDIYEYRLNPGGNFKNRLEKHTTSTGEVIVDRATRLMWYNGKPSKSHSWKGAKKWLRKLNQNNYWGFDDWRLPTVEEAATLLEKIKNPDGLHLNPVFPAKLSRIWTGDRRNSNQHWVILFTNGIIYTPPPQLKHYVLPVRSDKK